MKMESALSAKMKMKVSIIYWNPLISVPPFAPPLLLIIQTPTTIIFKLLIVWNIFGRNWYNTMFYNPLGKVIAII